MCVRRVAFAYLAALLIVAVATVCLILLERQLPEWFNLPLAVLAYLLVINMVTQAAGFGAGVLAAVASFLCLNFLFIEPRGTLLVHNVTDLILLAIFLIVALINNQLLGRAQRRVIEAAQRERDATRFYELSLALISARDAGEIANTLAGKLQDILGAQAIEVTLQPVSDGDALHALSPEHALLSPHALPDQPASHVEPVVSARVNFGEIRMWRAARLSAGEERLLRTFAGEAALILERMRMSKAETRAKVLEESDRLKTALLSSVSHELRTPLAAIRAGAESLRSGLVSPDSDAGRKILGENHYRVVTAATGEEGLALAAANPPDVIILDLGLPDMDGAEVCEQLREWTQTPIIVLSARDDQRQKVIALDKGADDYLTKPFGIEELMARLRVALRHGARLEKSSEPVVQGGRVKIDLARRIVTRDSEEVKLTATEFKLLACLARNADRVLTHHAILNEVWGMEYVDQIEYLRVYVRQLRAKLEEDPHDPQILLTEPGVGYRFVANVS